VLIVINPIVGKLFENRQRQKLKSEGETTMERKIVGAILGVWIAWSWTTAAVAADADTGKAIYEKSCVSCHGKDGKGNPAMAKVLGEKGLDLTSKDVTQKSDEQLLKIIAEGSGKMPAQKSLSKDEQKQVISYVRSLAK
jgi:cytochrome c6